MTPEYLKNSFVLGEVTTNRLRDNIYEQANAYTTPHTLIKNVICTEDPSGGTASSPICNKRNSLTIAKLKYVTTVFVRSHIYGFLL